MPPNIAESTAVLSESNQRIDKGLQTEPRTYSIAYLNTLSLAYGHAAAVYGLYLCFTEACWSTIFLAMFLHEVAILGTTAGAHRLWAHRTYKANLPLQILLVIMQSVACQNSVIYWSRDHRLHHKYSDTDADPHNAKRGFFFSHVGWLLVKKHPEARLRLSTIDMSDLLKNPLLKFQQRFAIPIIFTCCFILPTIIPMYFWGETFRSAWHVAFLRVAVSLHITFLVNSLTHFFGNKPYDRFIRPTQSTSISLATLGEGYHNYHHVFPWDYRAAELGNTALNFTTMFINLCARIGWAYELKTVSSEVIKKRAERTGDGTNLWGWGDKDLPKAHKDLARILCEKRE